MTVPIGLIGAGNVANAHLDAFEARDELDLAAVCEADEARAEEVNAEYGVPVWNDFEAFVTEAPIEAVDVTLPHHLHHPAAKAALEADLHALVEKPMAISMAEARELVDLAEERDRTLMAAQMQRFDPHNRAVRNLLVEGAIGPVRHARADGIQNLHDYADPPHWLYDGDAAGGGGIIGVLVHKLDLLRYFLGEPARACALDRTVSEDFSDAEDYAVGLLEFENDAIVDLFSTYSAAAVPYGESFWLFGDDGVIEAVPGEGEYVTDPRIALSRGPGSADGFEPVEPAEMPAGNAFTNELLHFVECVESGEEPISGGRDNLGTLATIFALYESADRDAEWVDVGEVRSG
jgi:predicted dehydrogenase